MKDYKKYLPDEFDAKWNKVYQYIIDKSGLKQIYSKNYDDAERLFIQGIRIFFSMIYWEILVNIPNKTIHKGFRMKQESREIFLKSFAYPETEIVEGIKKIKEEEFLYICVDKISDLLKKTIIYNTNFLNKKLNYSTTPGGKRKNQYDINIQDELNRQEFIETIFNDPEKIIILLQGRI